MRKSSAIFVSAVALGLAMFVPLKASAQGVTIYVNPGYPGYGGGYYRPGWGYGAAAVGAAAAYGAYGAYGYSGNYGCYYDQYGRYVCPQYPYQGYYQ